MKSDGERIEQSAHNTFVKAEVRSSCSEVGKEEKKKSKRSNTLLSETMCNVVTIYYKMPHKMQTVQQNIVCQEDHQDR